MYLPIIAPTKRGQHLAPQPRATPDAAAAVRKIARKISINFFGIFYASFGHSGGRGLAATQHVVIIRVRKGRSRVQPTAKRFLFDFGNARNSYFSTKSRAQSYRFFIQIFFNGSAFTNCRWATNISERARLVCSSNSAERIGLKMYVFVARTGLRIIIPP